MGVLGRCVVRRAWVLLCVVLLSGSWSGARAQFAYELGVGAKVGSPWLSGTVKYFWGNESAFEGLVHLGSFGVGVTALYEYHFYFHSVPGLRWFVGGGAHVASNIGYRAIEDPYRRYYLGYNPFAPGNYAPVSAGIDGVVGLEYVFEHIPLGIALDVTPLVNFPGRVAFWWNAGLAVRYLFK